MSEENKEDLTGGPAFARPAFVYCEDMIRHSTKGSPGMTLRQYAAIKLKVPDSGTEWLDAMITESRRMDAAYRFANAMLEAWK